MAFNSNRSIGGKVFNHLKLAKGWKGISPSRAGALVLVAGIAFGISAQFIWPGNAAAQTASLVTTLVVGTVMAVVGIVSPMMQVGQWASKLVADGGVEGCRRRPYRC